MLQGLWFTCTNAEEGSKKGGTDKICRVVHKDAGEEGKRQVSKNKEDGCRRDCTTVVGRTKRSSGAAAKMKARRSTGCTTVIFGGTLETRSRRDKGSGNRGRIR